MTEIKLGPIKFTAEGELSPVTAVVLFIVFTALGIALMVGAVIVFVVNLLLVIHGHYTGWNIVWLVLSGLWLLGSLLNRD
jgi:hypothetical protein